MFSLKNRFCVILLICSIFVLGQSWGGMKDEVEKKDPEGKISHGIESMKHFIKDNLDYLLDKSEHVRTQSVKLFTKQSTKSKNRSLTLKTTLKAKLLPKNQSTLNKWK